MKTQIIKLDRNNKILLRGNLHAVERDKSPDHLVVLFSSVEYASYIEDEYQYFKNLSDAPVDTVMVFPVYGNDGSLVAKSVFGYLALLPKRCEL